MQEDKTGWRWICWQFSYVQVMKELKMELLTNSKAFGKSTKDKKAEIPHLDKEIKRKPEELKLYYKVHYEIQTSLGCSQDFCGGIRASYFNGWV